MAQFTEDLITAVPQKINLIETGKKKIYILLLLGEKNLTSHIFHAT